jgi:hypothetical protein
MSAQPSRAPDLIDEVVELAGRRYPMRRPRSART